MGETDGRATPWRAWTPGVRVVVRRRLAEGGMGDVLGELLRSDDGGVRIRTRRGDVEVAADDILLGKVVPPAPARRRPRADADPSDSRPGDPATGHPGS